MQHDNIGYLLHQVAFRIDRVSDQVLLERLGIGYAQFKILMVLQDSDGVPQRTIATALDQTEAGISRQIALMNRQNLIVRKVSKRNRRTRFIFLTNKGQLVCEKALAILNHYHQPVFEALDIKQREQLLSILAQLDQHLTR